MMILKKLKFSQRILEKLKEKHQVTPEEIAECFLNRAKGFLEDTRTEHLSYPPTFWFITETDAGRKLKIVFIELNGFYEIKTAYQPNFIEVEIYDKYA